MFEGEINKNKKNKKLKYLKFIRKFLLCRFSFFLYFTVFYDSIDARTKLSEKLSDSAGRFKRGEGQRTEAKGYGEPHNMKIEFERRLTKQIANEISTLITKEDSPNWDLSAPGKINGKIIEHLPPDVKSKLGRSITADLTMTAKSKILSYFE